MAIQLHGLASIAGTKHPNAAFVQWLAKNCVAWRFVLVLF
jgi:hypothetical protein